MNSNFWIIIIILGAVLATWGNIQYNRSREAESKNEMANQAVALLRPELQRNLKILPEQQKLAQNNSYNLTPPFEIEAWSTVSKSNLLMGLPNNYLSELMQAYYLMNQANTLHSQIIESLHGVASALQNAEENRTKLNNDFRVAVRDTKPILESLLNKKL